MAETQQAEAPEFNIQRIYIKDISFEAPGAPAVFREQWTPQINLELNTKSVDLEDGIKEVVLEITVTAKKDTQIAFLAEIQQAGIFSFKHFSEDHMKHMLGAYCPNILFPYAREAVSDLVQRGGFPHLYLAPINFDALYQQSLQKADETKQ